MNTKANVVPFGQSDERQLRIDLAAAFRLSARNNWHEAVANHFSAAVLNDDQTRKTGYCMRRSGGDSFGMQWRAPMGGRRRKQQPKQPPQVRMLRPRKNPPTGPTKTL